MASTDHVADELLHAAEGAAGAADAGKTEYRYKAFISYRHADEDRRLAQWLHACIESYKTPQRLVDEGISPRLGVVFRDEEELSASADLGGAIETALDESEFLIVVCSPRTPVSRWVNEEVTRFRQLGRERRILACLIEGEPAEAFPHALYEVRSAAVQLGASSGALEPLAADFRPANGIGRRATWRIAKLKLFSTLLGCRFDDLVLREQARRRRILVTAFAAMSAVVVVIAALALLALFQRNIAEEQRAEAISQRDAALLTQSRFLADLARQRTDAGDASLGILLALEALPRDLSAPDRPYHPPAMTALADATAAQREVLTLGLAGADGKPAAAVMDAAISNDGTRLLVGGGDGTVALWDVPGRQRLFAVPVSADPIVRVAFGVDEGHVWAATEKRVHAVDLVAGNAPLALPTRAAAKDDPLAEDRPWVDVIFDAQIDDSRRRVVTVDRDHRTQLWVRDGGEWADHPPVGLEKGLVDWRTVSSDGRYAASGSSQSDHVVVFELESGIERARIAVADLGGKGGGTVAGAFTNRSDRLLVSRDSRVVVWDFAAKRAVGALAGHRDSVLRIAVSADDSMIATGSEDGTVKLWSADDNDVAAIASFDGFARGSLAPLNRGSEFEQASLLEDRMRKDFEGMVGHLAFSANGRRLLATSGDRTIRVFDVASRKSIAKVSGHTGRIDRVAIDAEGRFAATVGRDGTARIWRTSADPRIELFDDAGAVEKVVMPVVGVSSVVLVRHSGTSCGGVWRTWHAGIGQLSELQKLGGTADGSPLGSVSVDAQSTIFGSSQTGDFSIRDIGTGRIVALHANPAQGPVLCAYLAPGGKSVLFTRDAGQELQPVPRASGAAPGSARRELASLGNLWWSFAGSPPLAELEKSLRFDGSDVNSDGDRLLIRQADDNVALYDLTTRRLIRVFARPADAHDVKFSDNGKVIIGVTSAALRLWNAADGALAREIAVDAEPAFVALGGPEATHLVVASAKGVVKMFDLRTDARVITLGETFAAPVDIAFDRNGSRAIIKAKERDCSDVSPSLWDIREDRKVASLPVTQGCPYRFAFSRDGSEIVAAVSEPYRIALWESQGGARLAELGPCLPEGVEMFDGDPQQVTDAGFSDDGQYVYAATLAGAVCVWPNPGAGPALVAKARSSVPRSLTPEERKRFFLSDKPQK